MLLLCSFFAFSQSNAKLDSLKKVLSKLPKEGASFGADTMRVKVLCEMGEVLLSKDTSIIILGKAINISQNINWLYGLVISQNLYGKRLKKQNIFFKSEEFFFKSLTISKKNNFIAQRAYSLLNIGDIYSISKKPNEALKYYAEALKAYNLIFDKKGILLCYNNTGIALTRLNKLDSSRKVHQNCLNLSEKFSNRHYTAMSYHNIGHIDRLRQDLESAIYNYNRAIEIYLFLGESEQEQLASAYAGLAEIYHAKKESIKAKKYALSSISINARSITTTYFKASDVLMKVYAEEGDNLKAFEISQKVRDLQDSLNNVENDRRLASAKFEYDLESKSEELATEQEKQKWILWGGIAILIVILIILRNNIVLNKKNKLIENQKKEINVLNTSLEKKVEVRTTELQKANDELIRKNKDIVDALFRGKKIERERVASELHDNLGSTLSALKWRLEALNKDNLSPKEQRVYDGIQAMMHNAYSEVRLISHNLMPALLEEEGLFGAIEKYINDINLSDKLIITFETNIPNLTIDNKISLELYSICMELLNNILKHSKGTNATLKINKLADSLILIVSDNGVGIDFSKSQDLNMGFKNIKSRVETLNGELSFGNTASGLTTQIIFDYEALVNFKEGVAES